MSTARSPPEDAPAADIAAALREARFVRVLASDDGDSLAASGILARALRDLGVPFQVRVTAPDESDARPATPDDGRTITVGADAADLSIAGLSRPASVDAAETARELGVEPDPVLGLAGVVAAEDHIGTAGSGTLLDAAETRELVERRPGVAIPTADLGDGLAHTTLAHVAFSGDSEAVRAELADLDLPAELDEEAHRRVASLLAIDVATAEDATPRATEAVERALRPYATSDGPFETIGGYADVLDAAARERPGTGVALALGHDAARDAALDAWREHARVAHTALQSATTGRYDGLFVARVDLDPSDATPGRLRTAARLLRDYRSPEPLALVVSDGIAAAASVDLQDLPSTMAAAARRVADEDQASDADEAHAESKPVRSRYGHARFDSDVSTFITAFREEL